MTDEIKAKARSEITPEEEAQLQRERRLEELAEKHADRVAGFVIAALLVPGGLAIASRGGDALATLVFGGAMVVGGCVAALPHIFKPIAQDLIKKFLKDSD